MKQAPLLIALCCILATAPAWAQDYGTGVVVEVPQVDPTAITIDGQDTEDAWANAPTFDLVANADFPYDGFETPDLTGEAKALWSEDTLYVFARVFDNAIFIPEDPAILLEADQLLVGIDPTHAGDTLYSPDFGGAPENIPDLGPYAYTIIPIAPDSAFFAGRDVGGISPPIRAGSKVRSSSTRMPWSGASRRPSTCPKSNRTPKLDSTSAAFRRARNSWTPGSGKPRTASTRGKSVTQPTLWGRSSSVAPVARSSATLIALPRY